MLHLLAFNIDDQQLADQSLESWQIRITKRASRLSEVAAETDIAENMDVAIVCFDCIPKADQLTLIAALHGQKVCVVGLKDDRSPMFDLLDADADAVVSQSADASQIACAIWSAHHKFLANLQLNEQLREITAKTERREQIDRAKAGLAQWLHISEVDALGRIRRIARNSRRPMSEICRSLIEAQRLVDAARKLRPSALGSNAKPRTIRMDASAARSPAAPPATKNSVERKAQRTDSPAPPSQR